MYPLARNLPNWKVGLERCILWVRMEETEREERKKEAVKAVKIEEKENDACLEEL